MYTRQKHRLGFSLIEILFVAVVLGILAGIALFAAQEFYDSNRRKTVFDEVKSIGTGLSFAHDDIGFFPKIHLLNEPRAVLANVVNDATVTRPGFDTYGLLPATGSAAVRVSRDWNGPYVPIVSMRKRLAQGQQGLTKMRIPSALRLNIFTPVDDSIVDWPTDTWGNPYVVYQLVSDPTLIDFDTNPNGLRFINSAHENADFRVMVVSYGPNKIPGGGLDVQGIQTPPVNSGLYNQMLPLRLYIDGDVLTNSPGGTANYTLKEIGSNFAQAELLTPAFLRDFPASLNNPLFDPQESILEASPVYGEIGILDQAADDVIWAF
jgi:prepilin-type N-terminal cleavage/methylation domain-containing protein